MFFKTIPILGLKDNVSVDDWSMVQMVGDKIALTKSADEKNVDYNRKRKCCSKSFGDATWSNTEISGPGVPSYMYYYDTVDKISNFVFRNDKGYLYDTSENPVEYLVQSIDYSSLANGGGDGTIVSGDTVVGDTTATSATVVCGTTSASGVLYIKDVTGGTGNFSATESLTFNGSEETADCDSVIQQETLRVTDAVLYGETVIFAAGQSGAYSGVTPFICGTNDFYPLITATDATLYVFKYINEWKNHIIGLNSSESDGDSSIRWTEALPSGASVVFSAGNQLFKPGNDVITGSGKLGSSLFLVYGRDSISKLDYYPSATPVFGISTLLDGVGIENQDCLVSAFGSHWFFNKRYGFVRYNGSRVFNSNDIISKDIETFIATLDFSKINQIQGVHVSGERRITWAVTTSGASWPDVLLYYDVDSGVWSKEDRTDFNIVKMVSWPDDVGTEDVHKLSFSGPNTTDGHVYYKSGDVLDSVSGTLFDSYRVEPAMFFGDPKRKKFLKSVWFGIVDSGNYYLDVFYRNGETVKELEDQSWQFVGSLYLLYPESPFISMPTAVSTVDYDNASDTQSVGAIITGATNGYTATIIGNFPSSATAGTLYLSDLTGAFENNEEIESGEVGTPTADCDGASSDVVIKLDARYHQIKWGTDKESEAFSINRIEYEYEIGGNY